MSPIAEARPSMENIESTPPPTLQNRASGFFLWFAALWWVLLLFQLGFAWDLGEFYASSPLLLLIGPERCFSATGIIGMLPVSIACLRRRKWIPSGLNAAVMK
jgi:hypothetical protein